MANLDTRENAPLLESNPLGTGGKRLKVGIEGQSIVASAATLSTSTMRQTLGGDLQFGLPIRASENLTDPVDRFRVSQPQSMIDTDFEYGTQPTKWETLNMTNNRPFAYYNVQTPIAVTAISTTAGSRIVSVTTGTAVAVGTPVFIQDSTFQGANGLYVANTAGTTFTYTAQFPAPTTASILNTGVTTLYQGFVFTGAAIGGAPTFTWTAGTLIRVTTTVPHGLALGNEISVVNTSQVNANGSWVVARIVSNTIFEYYCLTAPAAAPTGGLVYARPQGTALHRAYDGGVKFSSNAQAKNEQLVRQTRKYFRYQSGKGIQFSTGSILKPSFTPDLMTSSGATVTVNTKEAHNLQVGASIIVSGANETAYNGTFTVTNIITPTSFTYTAGATPSATPASGLYNVAINTWVGGVVRLGMFDDQNGLFFEFDGTTLNAVRRSSTYQLAGTVTVTAGSNVVTGINTAFAKQLSVGEFIVIKGASYKVDSIASDTSLTMNPSYRGSTISAPASAVVTKTIDVKVPQSAWNIDRMNGAGGTVNPSSFNLDLTKMQMFYMDYSWYGAGAIRFGFRGVNGQVTYCHKIANNNVNFEAYMRTGNIPARYESNTYPSYTRITSTINPADVLINVVDTSLFPTTGTLVVRDAAGTYEYLNYTAKNLTSFSGITRAKAGETAGINLTVAIGSNVATVASTANIQVGMRVISSAFPDGTYVNAVQNATTLTLSNASTALNPTGVIFPPMGTGTSGQTFNFSATAPVSIESFAPTFAPIISHWGSSVIMDGRFDDDKQFIFTAGTTTALSVPTAGNRFALLSLRLAPSVDNGSVGAFGVKEILNRMQLSLNELGVYAQGNYLVTLVLNGTVSAADTWTNVGGSSLAQVCYHGAGRTITGGEVVGGFYVNSGGTTFGTSTYGLTRVRDLSNSILGGGAAAVNTQIYPDGPDIVTVMVQALTTGTSNVFGRLSWTEAQA